ncbi:MAG: beta-hydroxyacyl-ACP dehydratase [Chitinophagaceae bacterium]|nr:beta-hydroxyacyl-ACP dehydratase [Chitinophagaceae bacterium]MBK9938084.1 beta-hydroxyacyl-ACP dehydratase [Chitinophagaceae bacterium]
MTLKEIVALLPYTPPFLFVDELEEVTENGATGSYTFKPSEFFYEGHFKNSPITPGVILTETMGQIGAVCLGIYLLREEIVLKGLPDIALTSYETTFFAPVFPGEKVTVTSQKEYFRFSKLKCKVEMRNSEGKLICSGTIAGFIKNRK